MSRTELKNCLFDLRSDTVDDPNFTRAIEKALTILKPAADITLRFNVPRSLMTDTSIMRVGLASLLSREKDMIVVSEAENGEEAVSLSREIKPDVVVMDLMMPVMSGSEATRLITAETDDSETVDALNENWN